MNLTQGDRPDHSKLMDSICTKNIKLGLVPAWSYSTLKKYEECPYAIYIEKVKKIRGPSGPAAERGTAIHTEAEDFILGSSEDVPKNLSKFEDDFKELQHLHKTKPDTIEVEQNWGFTLEWNPTEWMAADVWGRIKLDAFVKVEDTCARVIDFKTGKRWGNEIGHSQQTMVYAIGTFMRYPEIEFLQTELWYLDQNLDIISSDFTREQALNFLPSLQKRALTFTTATEFNPTPSKSACKWCPYKEGEFPECKWGIK